MVLDVSIDKDSITVEIPKPFQLDLDGICGQIKKFADSKEVNIEEVDIEGLIPKLVRGISGCEGGCPSDAKGLASRGFKSFELQYIDGGILLAQTTLEGVTSMSLKMFPDF